jgi:membrane-bound serine protease (ClpP class)
LFDSAESDLTLDPNIVYAAAATFGGFTFAVGYLVFRSQRAQPALGREGLVGEIGQVRQAIQPPASGKIMVHGEYWTASANEAIEVGERVEVLRVDGLRLTVRRATAQTS